MKLIKFNIFYFYLICFFCNFKNRREDSGQEDKKVVLKNQMKIKKSIIIFFENFKKNHKSKLVKIINIYLFKFDFCKF